MKPLPLLAVLLFGIGTSCTDAEPIDHQEERSKSSTVSSNDATHTAARRISASQRGATNSPQRKTRANGSPWRRRSTRSTTTTTSTRPTTTPAECSPWPKATATARGSTAHGSIWPKPFSTAACTAKPSASCIGSTRPVWHRQTEDEYYNVYRSYLSKQLLLTASRARSRSRDSLQFYNVLRIRNLPEGSVRARS